MTGIDIGLLQAEQYAPVMAQQAQNYDALADFGLGLGIGGSLLGIAGTYYGLKAQQGAFKTEAMNAEFAANQANMRARAAEREAQEIIQAGQQAAAWRGAQNAQDVAGFRASTAASGVEVGTGSAGDIERALRINAEVDKRTIRTNTERRAAAVREQAANERTGALLGRASAGNLRASAASVNPAVGAVGATMSGAGNVIGQYLAYYGRR